MIPRGDLFRETKLGAKRLPNIELLALSSVKFLTSFPPANIPDVLLIMGGGGNSTVPKLPVLGIEPPIPLFKQSLMTALAGIIPSTPLVK